MDLLQVPLYYNFSQSIPSFLSVRKLAVFDWEWFRHGYYGFDLSLWLKGKWGVRTHYTAFQTGRVANKKTHPPRQGSDENLLLLDDGVAADEGKFLGFAGDNIVNAQNSIGQPYNAENPEDDAENPADQSDATQDPSQNPGNDTDDAQDDALVYMELREFGILGKEQGNEPQNADVAENAQQLVAFNIFRAAFSSVVLGTVNQFPQIVVISHYSVPLFNNRYGEANPHLFNIIIRFKKLSSEILCPLPWRGSQGQQNGGRNQQPQHDTGAEQNGKQRFHKYYLRQKNLNQSRSHL